MSKQKLPTPKDVKQVLRQLQMFNEQAAYLETSPFLNSIREKDGFSLAWRHNEGTTLTVDAPEDVATRAFFATFRLFFLQSDMIQIEQMFEMYRSLPLDEDLRRDHAGALAEYRQFMETLSPYNYNGKQYTNGGLLELFMYGHYVHLNRYDEFQENVPVALRSMVETIVRGIVIRILNLIFALKRLNGYLIHYLHPRTDGYGEGAQSQS